MSQPPSTPGPTWSAGAVVVGTPYLVRGSLGQGGMGSVYEVEHVHTRQVFALKVLSMALAAQPELVERVVREAEFLKVLNGAPHVVTIVEAGLLCDQYRRPYLVMERLYGETLRALLGQHALPLQDTLSYILQTLWGLALVHGKGVVHRDVKPENLFVQRDGTCTLLDFGVIKALYDIGLSPAQFSTGPKTPVGTARYMAPEVASSRAVDHRADIFAVGLVLAECLLGFRLLPYLSEDDYIRHLVNHGVPSIEESGGAHLPFEVRQLVRRATMFDPNERFCDALAFAAEINRVAELLGLRLRRLPPNVGLAPANGNACAPPSLEKTTAPTLAPSGGRPPPAGSTPPAPADTLPLVRGAERATLKSHQRPRFGVPTPGRGHDAAPPDPARGGSRAKLVPTTLPLPPSGFRPAIPKLEDAMAAMKGRLGPPVTSTGARLAAAPQAPAPLPSERRHDEPPDDAQRPVSTSGLRQGEPANSPAGRRARARQVAIVLGGAAVCMFVLVQQIRAPKRAVSVVAQAPSPPTSDDGAPAPPGRTTVNAPSVEEALPPPEASPRAATSSKAPPQARGVATSNDKNRGAGLGRPKQASAPDTTDGFGRPRRFNLNASPKSAP